jgi:presenilin-like A22 family membrane protease
MLTAAFLLLAIFCATGAAWTVYWSVKFGLTPRPPLSAFHTALRFAAVTSAIILLLFRRDWVERTTLLCAIVAAGSSALFGLGFRSTTLDVVRLLFHFVAYALGLVVSLRWLLRQARNSHSSFVVR